MKGFYFKIVIICHGSHALYLKAQPANQQTQQTDGLPNDCLT